MKILLRWMIKADLKQVMDIESRTSNPWTEAELVEHLQTANRIGMVAELLDGSYRIVGFMVYELSTCFLHVNKLAVAFDYRRQGIGRQLIEKLIGKLTPQKRDRLQVMVRESNLDAQLFLKSLTFLCHCITPDYFGEDGYLFVFELPAMLDVCVGVEFGIFGEADSGNDQGGEG